MNSFIPIELATTGLNAQRMRMTAIASNLANIHTTRVEGASGPYQRRDVIFTAQEYEPFEGLLARKMNGARTAAELEVMWLSQGVSASPTIDSQGAPRPVYDPDHPDANAEGYVLYPNVSVVKEMSDMISATHSYDANLAIIQATVSMLERALRISSSG